MHQSSTLSMGWDVQKESIAVADVAQAHHAAVVSLGNIGTRQCDIDHLIRQMPSTSQHLLFVSAAGPGGSWLDRSLTKKGQGGWVVAPSLLPQKPGERVKTTRRDALTLARRMRSGDLTPVYVPTVDDEAMRDLCRARAEALRELTTAQWRLTALLLRHALRSTGRAPWGPAHLRWRREVVCPTPAQQIVCQEYLRTVTDPPERRERRAQALTDPVPTWRRAPVVEALQALRGGPGTVAVLTVAALGALTRFANPRPRMPSRGFTPAASSTGERRRQGGLPQTGNSHARRALVAGAGA